MPADPKPLSEQTLVITGASSGIGLTTAEMAVEEGARVVLVSRDGDTLQQVADRLTAEGHQATHVAADVADRDAIQKVVEHATERFGGFDTWINNAGVSIYGNLEEGTLDDYRRLFDTNFWGVVNGSLAALPHLKERGGVLINIGSVLSERAIAGQGMYSASKHAVKGFTDALRMEMKKEDASVSVVLVKPGAINTPYPEHAKNLTDDPASIPPPVYDPHVAAAAILHVAEHPTAHITVGGGGKFLAALGKRFPAFMDLLMNKGGMVDMQFGDGQLLPDVHHTLYDSDAGPDAQKTGSYSGHVRQTSAYTAARTHPGVTALAVVGGLVAATVIPAVLADHRD